jgi:hypothetical protein
MANTKASNDRARWTYTTDGAVALAISAKSVYVTGGDAAKYGGSADTTGVPRVPKGFRVRRVRVDSSGGATRRVVVYQTTAALWTTPSTTITLDLAGTDTEFSNGAKIHRTSEREERDTIGIGK